MLKKNTAGQFIYFALIKASDGTAHTGQTPTGYVSIDAAAQTGIGGSIAELANGQYKLVLSQGDTNGDELGYFITNASSIPINISVTTETKKMADLNDIAAGALMGLANDAITSAKFDESSAYPLEAADSGVTQILRTGADGDTAESLSDQIDAVPDAAAINAEVDTALSDIHLDHLLAVDFASEAPVGNATSFLRQLVEDDSDTLRFTANTLEEAPGALGDATEAKQDAIITDLDDLKGSGFVKDTDSMVDLAHTGADSDTLEDLSDEIALIAAGDATEAKQDEILVDIVDIKGTGFVKDTDSLVDLAHIGADADTLEDLSDEIAAVAASLATTDGKIDTIDGIVDAIVIDTETTLDTVVDSILTAVGVTDGKVDTLDTAVDLIMDILEGDHIVDDGEVPYEYLIKRKGTADVLVTKEMYELDDTDITGVDQVVSKLIEPA